MAYLLFKIEVEFHQKPVSVGDLQRYVAIMTELWSHKSEQNFLYSYSGNAK